MILLSATLLLLSIIEICFYKKLSFLDFTKDRGLYLKGFLAVSIVLHHLAQRTDCGKPFSFFDSIGPEIVAVFFFISGYGLMSSFLAKGKAYFNHFLSKRIWKLCKPFVLVLIIYQVVCTVDGEGSTFRQIYNDLLQGDTEALLPSCWFIFAIVLHYLAFFIVFRNVKNVKLAQVFMLLYMIFYIVIFRYVLSFGFWWYISALSINVGLAWKYWENSITKVIKRHFISLAGTVALISVAMIVLLHQGMYWLELYYVPMFPIFLIVLFYYLPSLLKQVVCYLGVISYEIYLLQGVPLVLLKGKHLYVASESVYIALTLVVAILSAATLHFYEAKGEKQMVPEKRGRD